MVYQAAGNIDSARQVATRYLRNAKKDFHPRVAGMAYSVIGNEARGLKIMDSLWINNNNQVEIKKEDRLMQARQKMNKVFVMTMAEDYKGATDLLLSVSKEYPEFAEFTNLNNWPTFDRIKKKYPPFNNALSTLEMRQKVILDYPIKF